MPSKLSPKNPADKSLTPKQQRFVHEYLIEGNATQAAIRAGYAPTAATQSGSRLLRYAHVSSAVQEAEAARLAEITGEQPEKVPWLSPKWVIEKLRYTMDQALAAGNYAAANKALELLGRYLRLWSDDDSAKRAGQQVLNVKRVEVYLDRGAGSPPVLEGKAREVEALSPGFDAPPAAKEQAPS